MDDTADYSVEPSQSVELTQELDNTDIPINVPRTVAKLDPLLASDGRLEESLKEAAEMPLSEEILIETAQTLEQANGTEAIPMDKRVDQAEVDERVAPVTEAGHQALVTEAGHQALVTEAGHQGEQTRQSTAKTNYDSEEDVPTNSYIKSNLRTWHNKRYMGGWKHKQHGTEYFHAVTQTTTPQEIRAQRIVERFHRDTQTIDVKNKKAQSVRESFSQMVLLLI